ncbi:hypothetical protein B0H11DRAFT_2218473 [Mycena galericulata]|nr:hypothetical protein B0H11DRAFT_2218473 [Mycena galericulata]
MDSVYDELLFGPVLQTVYIDNLRAPLSPCTLGAPFALADPWSFQDFDKAADYVSRPPPALDVSPQSSTSSGSDFGSVSSSDAFEVLVGSQSRVVRLFNLPPAPGVFLSSVLRLQGGLVPRTMSALRAPTADFSVREACAALSLSDPRILSRRLSNPILYPSPNKPKSFELVSNAASQQADPSIYTPRPTRTYKRASCERVLMRCPPFSTFESSDSVKPSAYRFSIPLLCLSQKCAAHNWDKIARVKFAP